MKEREKRKIFIEVHTGTVRHTISARPAWSAAMRLGLGLAALVRCSVLVGCAGSASSALVSALGLDLGPLST
jgi:hypothetical protein